MPERAKGAVNVARGECKTLGNYQVGPGQSVQTATVFILTNSEGKFTLTSQWDPSFDVGYQSRFPGC